MSSPTAFKVETPPLSKEPVIQLDGISVCYRAPQEQIPSFKEYAIRWLKREIRYNEFLAIKNFDLSVYPGEVLGIVGPNGAGKSTLLKVVARVLKPTLGRVRIRGRVSPLLELGAGFDPELTGRENVYLNGAILGFTKADLDARFDRIIEFAGVQDFIDAPVRTYSTGMVARLGFSVATDVQPEILIVDEILGVGDAEFQTKSFERIQSFQAAGSTILLVSHSLEKVREMCSRVIWLDRGQLVASGSAEAVVGQYLEQITHAEGDRLANARETEASCRWGNRKIEITAVRILDQNDTPQAVFETGSSLNLELDYMAQEPVEGPIFGIAIHHHDGVHITGPNTKQAGLKLKIPAGPGKISYMIPALSLLEGLYHISVAVVSRDDTVVFDYHDRAYPFRVVNKMADTVERYGMVTLNGEWNQAE
jgi:lipopolysaccharide transport system ATP-binding protein